MKPSILGRIWRGCLFVPLLVLMTTSSAMAQSTFNGFMVDADGGALPGVSVILVNLNTGVVREGTSNGQGLFNLPGLEPGTYSITTTLPGFATETRDGVALGINQTLSLDITMALAGLAETVTVTGEAPLIEVTQSTVATSIEANELVNTPLVNRTIAGMLNLLPGATPIAPLHRTKSNAGTTSFGGSRGGNMSATVDGADNRDNHYGGPLMSFTTEGIEQFELATTQFNATDGRSSGAALSLVTKSGTNTFRGSAFIYERDEALTAKDFFTKESDAEKVPFSRQTYGGSIGGPLLQNRVFFFAAGERMQEVTGISVPQTNFDLIEGMIALADAGQLPEDQVYRNHSNFIQRNGSLTMISSKVNAQLSNNQSVSYRYAYQRDRRDNARADIANDNREIENIELSAWSGAGQHSLVMGNRGLNQFTFQTSHMPYVSNSINQNSGAQYTADFPNTDIFPNSLEFAGVSSGGLGSSGSRSDRWVIQFRDDVSMLVGAHSFRVGVDYKHLPGLGLENGNEQYASYTFFDSPLTILNNTNGLYPQGLQTPGALQQWTQANGGALNGVGSWGDSVLTAEQFGAWFQDDWRVTSNLTLNLGVRYDTDFNLMDEPNWDQNLTMLALRAIGHEHGVLPNTPRGNISPRVGFAWDASGTGATVVRGGYGYYYDQYNTAAAGGDIIFLNRRPINAVAEVRNTSVGVGQVPTFRYGIDPDFAQPPSENRMPSGSTGEWIANDIVSPQMHHFHIGVAQTLGPRTVLTADYTRTEGRNSWKSTDSNPRIDGSPRILASQFGALNGTIDGVEYFADPNLMSRIDIMCSCGEQQYDALTFRLQQRFDNANFQAHYTLAKSSSYGGSSGNRSGAPASMHALDPKGPGEWGPNSIDERHRFVMSGVFELPYGIQLSPVVQIASARPYQLRTGRDTNRDGRNNDRFIFADGTQASVNSARGDHTFVADLRATKFVPLGGSRQLGLFFELLNLTDTVNFGNSYQGNGRSSNFQQPTGYLPGIGYPRQIQLGSRFLF
jgi:hypothetical protein